jgi:hypothetical protein
VQARDVLGFFAHYFQQTTCGSFLWFVPAKIIAASI